MEIILDYWLYTYLISTAISLIWYLAICRWSRRRPSWVILLMIFTVLPFYLIIPINVLALYAGWKHRKDIGLFKGYCYYNVRLLFRQETADNIYGQYDIVPLKYFQQNIDKALERSANKAGWLHCLVQWFNQAHKKIRTKLNDAVKTFRMFL